MTPDRDRQTNLDATIVFMQLLPTIALIVLMVLFLLLCIFRLLLCSANNTLLMIAWCFVNAKELKHFERGLWARTLSEGNEDEFLLVNPDADKRVCEVCLVNAMKMWLWFRNRRAK